MGVSAKSSPIREWADPYMEMDEWTAGPSSSDGEDRHDVVISFGLWRRWVHRHTYAKCEFHSK